MSVESVQVDILFIDLGRRRSRAVCFVENNSEWGGARSEIRIEEKEAAGLLTTIVSPSTDKTARCHLIWQVANSLFKYHCLGTRH